jgi:hypothetical protein
MKYGKYAILNNKGQYVKYPTAYRNKPEYTNSLYDVHLWDFKEDAEKLAEYMGLKVLLV